MLLDIIKAYRLMHVGEQSEFYWNAGSSCDGSMLPNWMSNQSISHACLLLQPLLDYTLGLFLVVECVNSVRLPSSGRPIKEVISS